MSTKWPEATIGEVCQLHTGGTPSRAKPEFFENGDIPWLVSGDVNRTEILECEGRITEAGLSSSNAKFLPLNSVVIALAGQGKTRGTVALLRIKATCNQSVVAISPNSQDQLLPEYLFWNLKGRYQEIRRMSGDDERDRRGLNMAQIRSIRIPLPPLDEQKRIVTKLDKVLADLDQVTENTKDSLNEIDALWSVSIDNSFSLINPSDSEFEIVKLGDVADFRPPKKQAKEVLDDKDEVTFMGMNALGELEIDESLMDQRSLSDVYSSYTYFRDGDILLAKITPCYENGKLSIAKNLKNGVGFGSSEFMVIRPGKDLVPEYIQYFLAQNSIRFQAINNMTGSVGHKRVPEDFIKSLEIARISRNEQNRIVAKLNGIKVDVEALKLKKKNTLSDASKLRSSILSAAFAGDF